jgi:NAD(P)H dehydrogenase (quinone)
MQPFRAMTIAVTGATGELGGRVARRLAARGAPLRLVVRDPERAPDIAGAEVAVAESYRAGGRLRDALRGADTVFLVSGREEPDRVASHFSAVDAAVAAGVRRIVYTSFVNASPDATFTLVRHHFATEERIRASGVAYTFLRDSLYLDFVEFFAGEDGVIRGPAGEGHVAPVARDDIADVAAVVLAEDGHQNQTYTLTGAERRTMAGWASELARVTGRPVEFADETVEEAYASRAHFGAPDWEVEGWVTTYLAIARGELDVVTDTVERLTGHPPKTLEQLLAVS